MSDDLLTVVAGEPFDMELAAAPTTGYTWELVAPPEGVALLSSDFKVPPDAAIGGSATQVFHLQATQAGHFDLTFQLRRRWEAEPIETRMIEVEAQ